jgi:hypothetical protein
MTVEYDMATEADELVIKDANSGEVLYSLKSASK